MKKIDEWSERQLAGPRKQMKLINLWELIDWFCFCGVFDGFHFCFFIVGGYGRWHRQWLRRKRRRRKKSNSNQTSSAANSIMSEVKIAEWKQRKQTNSLVDLVDFCCAMGQSNWAEHQGGRPPRQAIQQLSFLFLCEEKKWNCWNGRAALLCRAHSLHSWFALAPLGKEKQTNQINPSSFIYENEGWLVWFFFL